ncbi:hypothetical protein XmelCFBP4644_08800 [Xanthomonas melonis]|uniref:Uncharacterized protein n=1 Tax=Xanthomonas melonis TaxID=56456 RepID=A0A2S7DH79_9XANT|nr:hypothetical protein XmelCFBP4644_08800 [Xanthomonas melonis]
MGEVTAPERWSAFLCELLVIRRRRSAEQQAEVAYRLHWHTDHFDWSLPARRRGTLRGMDAA